VEEGILLLKGGGEKIFLPVRRLPEKVIVLSVNYTNQRIAANLREQGVPFIEDKDAKETRMWHLKQMAEYALRYGGVEKVYFGHHQIHGKPVTIRDTGKPIFQSHGVTVDATRLTNEILKLKERRIFLQTRLVFTQIGIQRHRKPRRKFKTILWSSPQSLDLRYPTHLEIEKKLPEAYLELTRAVFYLAGIFENYIPPSISIELATRQPDTEAEYALQFQFKND
jgi:hypothetical protein